MHQYAKAIYIYTLTINSYLFIHHYRHHISRVRGKVDAAELNMYIKQAIRVKFIDRLTILRHLQGLVNRSAFRVS
jgi:hypothetical protein